MSSSREMIHDVASLRECALRNIALSYDLSLAITMNSVELVIFDLAGTTVEDRGEVPAAFTGALAEHGSYV